MLDPTGIYRSMHVDSRQVKFENSSASVTGIFH